MLNLNRVCVPLSLDCNIHCKYCYRDKERIDRVPDFTEDMKNYLKNLNNTKCEAVIASGGEPLMHWDKVQELFSYVPKNVHKKIMSNCTLLTQEMVDYINQNEVELSVSHDGPKTKFLRSVDVLENEKICSLIRQVKIMRVVCVTTKHNPDVWENFFDTATKLGRVDFEYLATPIFDIPSHHELIEGFDYDKWYQTWMEFSVSKYRYLLPWYRGKTLVSHKKKVRLPSAFNVLPNGIVCGMAEICSNYGTIFDDYDECYHNLELSGWFDYCKNKSCKFVNVCTYVPVCNSDHMHKWRSMILTSKEHPEKVKILRQYVSEHISDIEKKYGFKGVTSC